MYYEERIIAGILHSRSTPTGEWKPTTKVMTLLEALERIKQAYDNLEDYAGVEAKKALEKYYKD